MTSTIAALIITCQNRNAKEKQKSKQKAYNISRSVLWKNFINHYYDAYDLTLQEVEKRADLYKSKVVPDHLHLQKTVKQNKPIWKKMLVKSEYPKELFSDTSIGCMSGYCGF